MALRRWDIFFFFRCSQRKQSRTPQNVSDRSSCGTLLYTKILNHLSKIWITFHHLRVRRSDVVGALDIRERLFQMSVYFTPAYQFLFWALLFLCQAHLFLRCTVWTRSTLDPMLEAPRFYRGVTCILNHPFLSPSLSLPSTQHLLSSHTVNKRDACQRSNGMCDRNTCFIFLWSFVLTVCSHDWHHFLILLSSEEDCHQKQFLFFGERRKQLIIFDHEED